jgi:hypothetical protein
MSPPFLADQHSTPPLTDKKPSAGALHIITLLRDIQEGTSITGCTQIESELRKGDYYILSIYFKGKSSSLTAMAEA